jgi:hypothetical protein
VQYRERTARGNQIVRIAAIEVSTPEPSIAARSMAEPALDLVSSNALGLVLATAAVYAARGRVASRSKA